MIRADQPNCFPEAVVAAVSSRSDGTMLERGRTFHDASAVYDRRRFCEQAGVDYADCVFQLVQYGDEQTYDRLTEVDRTDTTAYRADVAADGLFTAEPGVGLFLPVADCVATVLYDPTNKFLALLHLGRHGTVANLSLRAMEAFRGKGSRPAELIIWMSPSAKRETYSVDRFDDENNPDWQGFFKKTNEKYHLDLPGYNRARFIEKGVLPKNIFVSPVNTMTDSQYFSHRAGDVNGRIAVVAMMR